MVTNELFRSFVDCPYKGFLKVAGMVGTKCAFEQHEATQSAEFSIRAADHLTFGCCENQVIRGPTSLSDWLGDRPSLILDATASESELSWKFHGIDCRTGGVTPIRFVHRAKPSYHDKLVAACDGVILSEAYRIPIQQVQMIYGPALTATKVNLRTHRGPTRLAIAAQRILGDLRTLIANRSEPKMVLNRHCTVCEFRNRCRQQAEQRDDLSLLQGLTSADVASMNARGIFTVTQLAYTFRAKTMGRGSARRVSIHNRSRRWRSATRRSTFGRDLRCHPHRCGSIWTLRACPVAECTI
jgi:hypothetical protein